MSAKEHPIPIPRRVAAGRRNPCQRGPLSEAGRKALRQAALRDQPWQRSTGPRTPAGNAKVAENGRKQFAGQESIRKVRAELQAVRELIREIKSTCNQIDGA